MAEIPSQMLFKVENKCVLCVHTCPEAKVCYQTPLDGFFVFLSRTNLNLKFSKFMDCKVIRFS